MWRFSTKYFGVFGIVIPLFKNGGRRWYDDDEDNIQVDLEELVADYVWPKFTMRYRFPLRLFMNRRNYMFDISWNHLEFKDHTIVEDSERSKFKLNHGTNVETPGKGEQVSQIEGKGGSEFSEKENTINTSDDGEIKEQYKTEYVNMSDNEQVYEFKHSVTKALKSSVELQEKYTRGSETHFALELDKIVELGVKSTVLFTVTGKTSQEFSEMSQFDNATKIIVPPFKKAVAVLYIIEKHSKSRFTIQTTVKPYYPDIGLPVTVRRARDGKAVYNARIYSLHKLFDTNYLKHSKKIVKLEEVKELVDNELWMVEVIVLTTRGLCTTLAPKTQNIDVKYEDLPKLKQK